MCAPAATSSQQPPAHAGPVVLTHVHDADGHERTVRGANVRAIRLGQGVGPNLTATRAGSGFVATWVRAGFPMASRATSSPDRTYAIATIDAPPGSQWCGHALRPGEVLFYGPDVQHTAVNPVGVNFAFAAMETQALCEAADTMGLKPDLPTSGEVRVLKAGQSGASGALWRSVAALADPHRMPPHADEGSRLLRTTVQTLTEADTWTPCRSVDSGAVVSACIDYAEELGRIPSIQELCAVTFVCRRKLWSAFDECYGSSPARFLRLWGLARARTRLRQASPGTLTVLEVANDLGFHHAGRFASGYRQHFGESPSQTLRAGRP